MSEKIVRNKDVELFTQSFGDRADPPILLIMGAMASMLWWSDDFCSGLAQAGFFVIRYDNRDTGLSTHYEPGKPTYTTGDMLADAIAIIDAYGFQQAHVVGMSAGGIIAQRAALAFPDRVKTLTLISTTPIGSKGLPPATETYAAHSQTGSAVDWSDNSSILEFMLRDVALIASTKHPHDAEAARRLVEADMKRARNFPSAANHFLLLEDGDDSNGVSSDLTLPALVIHGTSDPLFPLAHGEALAKAIKGAELLQIDGGGHEIHQNDSSEIVKKIATFVNRIRK